MLPCRAAGKNTSTIFRSLTKNLKKVESVKVCYVELTDFQNEIRTIPEAGSVPDQPSAPAVETIVSGFPPVININRSQLRQSLPAGS